MHRAISCSQARRLMDAKKRWNRLRSEQVRLTETVCDVLDVDAKYALDVLNDYDDNVVDRLVLEVYDDPPSDQPSDKAKIDALVYDNDSYLPSYKELALVVASIVIITIAIALYLLGGRHG